MSNWFGVVASAYRFASACRDLQSRIFAKGHPMKLADIPPGSELAYHCAAKQIAEQVEFEL
ncbi:MAG: hypothetical protein ACLPND_12165, partial [Candidatus Korobacteraceae bacterium]